MTLLLALELREEQYLRLRPSWLCYGSHSQPECPAEAGKLSRTPVFLVISAVSQITQPSEMRNRTVGEGAF